MNDLSLPTVPPPVYTRYATADSHEGTEPFPSYYNTEQDCQTEARLFPAGRSAPNQNTSSGVNARAAIIAPSNSQLPRLCSICAAGGDCGLFASLDLTSFYDPASVMVIELGINENGAYVYRPKRKTYRQATLLEQEAGRGGLGGRGKVWRELKIWVIGLGYFVSLMGFAFLVGWLSPMSTGERNLDGTSKQD